MAFADPEVESPSSERGSLATVARLLHRGLRTNPDGAPRDRACLGLGATGLALFGAALGFYQGGLRILMAAAKVTLVGGFSLVLLLPSLFLVTALAGVEWSGGRFARVVVRYWAVVGLGAAALAPMAFVFAASSRHLSSLVVWSTSFVLVLLLLGLRLLDGLEAAKGALRLWSLLAALVVLQAATLARPVLWGAPGEPEWTAERRSFAQQFGIARRIVLASDADQSGAESKREGEAE
jgi:hypothetical protein